MTGARTVAQGRQRPLRTTLPPLAMVAFKG
jgi:hypothetical protein